MSLNLIGWARVFGPDTPGADVANELQGYFSIPDGNLCTLFRVVVPVLAGVSINVKLRFGFDDADALAATNGCDSGALLAAGSILFNVVYDIAAVAPGVVGNPLAMLPPRVAVLATTVGAGSAFQVFATMLHVL